MSKTASFMGKRPSVLVSWRYRRSPNARGRLWGNRFTANNTRGSRL